MINAIRNTCLAGRRAQYAIPSFSILVAALAALLPTYLIRFEIFGIPTTLWEIALYVIVLVGLTRRQLRLSTLLNHPLRIPLLLFLMASLGALIPSQDWPAALGQWKALFLDAVLFLWLLLEIAVKSGQFKPVLGGYLVGATLVGLHAFWGWLVGDVTADGRVLGVYAADPDASPNYLALFGAPAVPLAFFWAFENRSRVRVSLVLAGLIILAAVTLSGSRAALLAVLLGLVVGVVWQLARRFSHFSRLIWAGAALFLVIGGLFVIPRFLPDFSSDPMPGRVATSNNIRWEIWRTTLTTVIPQMSPLGVGWANYQTTFTELTKTWVNYPEYVAPLALHPHNFFLMTLVTTGWLGLLAWLWIIGRALKSWWRLLPVHLPIGLAFLAWLIQGLVDTTYFKNDLAPLTWLVLIPFLLQEPVLAQSVENRETPNTSS